MLPADILLTLLPQQTPAGIDANGGGGYGEVYCVYCASDYCDDDMPRHELRKQLTDTNKSARARTPSIHRATIEGPRTTETGSR